MDGWSAVAGVYDVLMTLSGWHRAQATFVKGLTDSVLDVGCGTAFLADVLGPGYVGVDRSTAMLIRARTTRVIRTEASALPLRDRSFDIVVTTGFLGLLDPQERAVILPELVRVCRREIHLLEPLAPLNAVRRAIALSRHPLELTELADAGLEARIAGSAVFAGSYTPVIAHGAPSVSLQ